MPRTGSFHRLIVAVRAPGQLIWRRLRVTADTSIADLHAILQAAFGWSDEYLHRFTIHAVKYGLWRPGAPGFSHDAHRFRLADFALRPGERFTYEYNFFAPWRHDLRVEKILPAEKGRSYPVCTAGARSAPPEECGGVRAFLRLRQQLPRVVIAARMAEVLAEILDAPDDHAQRELLADHRDEMAALLRYARLDGFGKAALNRHLRDLPLGREGTRP
ncbi:plasmid pRiA4b ORF-3 family protein [Streptomyces sp. NPDC054766]